MYSLVTEVEDSLVVIPNLGKEQFLDPQNIFKVLHLQSEFKSRHDSAKSTASFQTDEKECLQDKMENDRKFMNEQEVEVKTGKEALDRNNHATIRKAEKIKVLTPSASESNLGSGTESSVG